MLHAIETSEHIARERKMLEYEYISMMLDMCALKQENANNQRGIFTFLYILSLSRKLKWLIYKPLHGLSLDLD